VSQLQRAHHLDVGKVNAEFNRRVSAHLAKRKKLLITSVQFGQSFNEVNGRFFHGLFLQPFQET
jgi:hypothetical protein